MQKFTLILILAAVLFAGFKLLTNGDSISGPATKKPKYRTVQGILSAGESYAIAIGADGSLYGWGKNDDEQLIQRNPGNVHTPIRITTKPRWKFVHAGTGAAYAISNRDKLWHYTHEPDRNKTPFAFSPLFPSIDWTKVQESFGFVVGLDTDGNLWTWMHDDLVPGISSKRLLSHPTAIEPKQSWIDFCNDAGQLYAVAADGNLWKNFDTTPDVPHGPRAFSRDRYRPEMTRIPVDAELRRVICRQNAGHVLAIDRDGYLWGFGHNSFGELGDGDGEVATRPKNVDESEIKRLTDMRWIDVALGHNFTVGIAADGSLWGWGRPFGGVLGIGEIPRSFSADTDMPRLADDTRSWLSVDAGNSFSTGVTRDGEVFTWGAQALANGGASGARMVPKKIAYDLVLDVPLAQ